MKTHKTLLVLLVLLPTVILAQQSLTVLTLNVWSGLDYEGVWEMGEYESESQRNQRYEILVRELKDLAPDVICLQEVNPVPEYARRLARELDYQAYGFVGMGGIHLGPVGIPVNFREGDAILVKKEFAVESLGRKKLSGGGISTNWITLHLEEINQIMGLRISRDGDTVDVYNTHLHAGPDYAGALRDKIRALWKSQKITSEKFTLLRDQFQAHQDRRMLEIGKAVRFIRNHSKSGHPVIFAGDFNMRPESGEADELTSLGFVDTHEQAGSGPMYTWNPLENTNIKQHYHRPDYDAPIADRLRWYADMTARRIDYIWFRTEEGDMSVERVALFGDEAQGGIHLSDHFGYVSEFVLE
ncbi:MAG: endonuclease/exonuclease/phosphatase family protein [Candidatus Marinimicrobia bacterium]|nr:endonuclease/exonuclease/phosphatase family protein [Candidatus Neomarinimicrobiota bacterium]MCF7828828.1 endonuclease/exonuclease/phosphatase family protein [Candidatus Neomarinimicrobiota bacterium]MCF7880745.1 endonuclease/exonuclease/phosphatase family protein [Candidatus Neomarinimicrobiota bacterium]